MSLWQSLTNKETVDYVIDHLAAANLTPSFFILRRNQKQFINQFVGTKHYNMSKSIDNISSPLMRT
jgi:NADPH:quinone reductase-like Zn-dependent oxidoreductase